VGRDLLGLPGPRLSVATDVQRLDDADAAQRQGERGACGSAGRRGAIDGEQDAPGPGSEQVVAAGGE
jgi:hypothetical protein